jgi:hypothetical protein
MIAILKFKLPDEDYDFRAANEGVKTRLALQDLDEAMRSRVKYGFPDEVKTAQEAYEEIRGAFFDVLEQHDIRLEW